MRLAELCFLKGERRYVQFEILSTKQQKVVVLEANYTIKHEGEVVDSGSCEIVDDSILQIMVDAFDVGSYDLEITYTIAPEVRKVRCKFHVG